MNVYIIRDYPGNKTKVSKSRVYDMAHLKSYLEEMETGEDVIIKVGRLSYKIRKLGVGFGIEPEKVIT